MKNKVTDIRTMTSLQGQRVLVEDGTPRRKGDELILTIVHLVDVNKRELLLVNRSEKARSAWELDQKMMDLLVPLKGDPRADWKLVL